MSAVGKKKGNGRHFLWCCPFPCLMWYAQSAVPGFSVLYEHHVCLPFLFGESFSHQPCAEQVGVVGVQPEGDGDDDIPVQLDLFGNQEKKEKLEKLDRTVDEIRRRFGYFSIQRAAMYQDKVLSHLDAGTHTIHPHSYFHG